MITVKLPQYINNKIAMLREDFKMRLSKADIAHFRSLTTENEVDRFAHELFMRKLK